MCKYEVQAHQGWAVPLVGALDSGVKHGPWVTALRGAFLVPGPEHAATGREPGTWERGFLRAVGIGGGPGEGRGI